MPNQQNYGKIAQNFFSSLRYSPFLPKVDFDDVNIRRALRRENRHLRNVVTTMLGLDIPGIIL